MLKGLAMSLNPGAKLGPYEIIAPLGAGGMGEVYKAKDLKLGRDIAIKVLRENLASDPERLRRFEQEARAASSLNHPNIEMATVMKETREGVVLGTMGYMSPEQVRGQAADHG